jgi:glucose-6-phosphate 1-dehydrogenase
MELKNKITRLISRQLGMMGQRRMSLDRILSVMKKAKETPGMRNFRGSATRSDALVLFGVTGDLAYKMIFPALYAIAKRGALTVPVIGVASSKWSVAQLRKRAVDSIRTSGRVTDRAALNHLSVATSLCQRRLQRPEYLQSAQDGAGQARHPAHYLAIPPALFPTVIKGLGAAGLADHARVIVEKPFGRDLELGAAILNGVARSGFLRMPSSASITSSARKRS